jgi:hypothetical protein
LSRATVFYLFITIIINCILFPTTGIYWILVVVVIAYRT